MNRQSNTKPRLIAVRCALLLTATLFAAGCREMAPLDYPTAAMLSDHERRHAIQFSSKTEALYVEIAGGTGLTSNQETDVWRFIDRYKKEGTGRLKVAAPGGPKGHMMASRAVRQVKGLLEEHGIPPDAVETARVPVGSRYGDALKIAYDRPVAIPPRCGDWPEDLGPNRERVPYQNFGCYAERNLALMVANPRDLQTPQEETPSSSERRSQTWRAYAGGGSGGSAAITPTPSAVPPVSGGPPVQ